MDDRSFQLSLILGAIARGARTLQQIVVDAGGMYPVDVEVLLRELVHERRIELVDGDGYRLLPERTDGSKSRRTDGYLPTLPEPHALDYDWRFEPSTAHQLAVSLLRETALGGGIVLFGAPSVFLHLARLRTAVPVTLVEQNEELVRLLAGITTPTMRVAKCDLMSGNVWSFSRTARAALCDPPWYPEHYATFLAQASCACEIGASIYVSMLQPGTRPGAIKDRLETINIASELGLHVHSVTPDAIQYQTPGFESASLKAAGIQIEHSWRKGDLFIFRKISEPSQSSVLRVLSIAKSVTTEEAAWGEVLLERRKVKLRRTFDDTNQLPEIFSIEKDDRLPTVSRRYSGRAMVDLWLWDNRVFGVRNRAAVWRALHLLSDQPVPRKPLVPSKYVDRALQELQRILALQLPAGDAPVPEKTGVATLKRALEKQRGLLDVRHLVNLCTKAGIRGHLAILNQPYLDKILRGEKTIESRFTKNRVPPHGRVIAGDTILLKESSGPLLGLAVVSQAEYFGPLETGDVRRLINENKAGLAPEDDFYELKKESKYASLLHLTGVTPLEPLSLSKTDRRAWIVLDEADDVQQELF